MNFRPLAYYIMDQAETVTRAPLAFALGLALASVLIWRLMKLVYDDRLARLRKAIERKDSMIALLKNGRPPLSPVLASPAIQAPAATETNSDAENGDDREARQKALRRITNAIDAAELARHAADPREADRAMQAMGLALHAARSTFGLPIAPAQGSASADLASGKALLELVRPALFVGQDDEARRIASAFLRGNRAAAATG